MGRDLNEQMDRQKILDLVAEYCRSYHTKPEWREGDRIPYASRVYDEREMCSLVDSALDFWLTTGRYAERFEREFAEFLGVRFCSLTNSGSSANLLAFSALTSPLLGERAVRRTVVDRLLRVSRRHQPVHEPRRKAVTAAYAVEYHQPWELHRAVKLAVCPAYRAPVVYRSGLYFS